MATGWEPTKHFIQKTTPFEGLKEIRSMFLDFLKAKYLDDPFVKKVFSKWDNPTLVEKASQSSQRAREYNPHEEVDEFVGFLNSVSAKINYLLAFLLVVTTYAGLESRSFFAYWFSNGVSLITFLPATVVAIPVLYLGLLRMNSDTIKTYNENLVIPESEIRRMSRKRADVVSYYLWNRCLKGQKFTSLLALCYILECLSNFPVIRRWMSSPTEYILKVLNRHWDVYKNEGSYLSVARTTMRKEWKKRNKRS
ncbi:hypothetical protein [Natrialba sp. SSL1]|uniref:hypothetical protein n=1 Tax=Natrialba sp. SSL1 TaxID=1869245 RepID=UPI00111330B3|nr:hypothetical protein [Natrialba sp. SSL1]